MINTDHDRRLTEEIARLNREKRMTDLPILFDQCFSRPSCNVDA